MCACPPLDSVQLVSRPPRNLPGFSRCQPNSGVDRLLGAFPDDLRRLFIRSQPAPTRLPEAAIRRAFAVAHLADQFRPDERDALRVLRRKPCVERGFVGVQWFEDALEFGQFLLGESGTDSTGEVQPTLVGDAEHQRTDTA